MDDDQQGAWWTTPPRAPARPGDTTSEAAAEPRGSGRTRRAGPPDDEIEVRTEGEPDAEPSLFTPLPSTGQVPVVRPPVIRPPAPMRAPVGRPPGLHPSVPTAGSRTPAATPPRPAAPPPPPSAPPLPPPAPPLPPPTATGRVDLDPPTRPVEYLTVRLDPEPSYRSSGDTMEVPAAAMPRMRQAAAAEDESAPQSTFRRGPAIVLGVGVLVVIVVVAVIASIVATGVDPDRDRDPAGDGTTSAAALVAGTQPPNLTQITRLKATALLRMAAARPAGTIKQSFTWNDDNGENLLVTAVDATASGTTLSVVHVARLDTKPRVLRTMIDPNLPECSSGSPHAGFTTGSMFVRDIDDDGKAEATVGWSSWCGDADNATSVAKLALISDGRKFIIRGEGVIGGKGDPEPDPVASDWPPGFHSPVAKLYRTLYF